MSIKIIGAGLPRTGTHTLKASLEKLGYTKTYHMKELMVNPKNLRYWITLRNSGTTDWDELYNGYQATVDFPGYPWYKEHMKRYPEAKVILTVRPFESWYTSIHSTIWSSGPQTVPEKVVMMTKLLVDPRLRSVIKCVKFAKETIFHTHLQDRFTDKAFAEKIFNKHIEDVKSYVPAEKLLVYNVTEGWEPLCKFLGVPVRDEPFPHLNKKEQFKGMLAQLVKGQIV
ncbi:MAG TPA: sulfotransferase [Chryseosolibacter sp.]